MNMMAQFEMWKLLVDAGLGISLLYLALRFIKAGVSPQNVRQVQALESSLKGLIHEADMAGSTFNDQLVRRQQSLESLLRDLESAEGRIQRSAHTAEQSRLEFDRLTRQMRDEALHAGRAATREQLPPQPQVREQAAPPVYESQREEFAAPVQPVVSRARSNLSASIEATSARGESVLPAAGVGMTTEPQAWKRVNIFGEEIEEAAPAVQAVPTSSPSADYRPSGIGLRAAIEKDIARSPAARTALEEIYSAAETMLRSGKDLEQVSARTRLPIEEVRYLSEKVQRPEDLAPVIEEPSAPMAEDSRLGVLSGIKRQVQTL